MNAEIQLQNCRRVIGLTQSSGGLSDKILAKWRTGMRSASFDTRMWPSELRSGSKGN